MTEGTGLAEISVTSGAVVDVPAKVLEPVGPAMPIVLPTNDNNEGAVRKKFSDAKLRKAGIDIYVKQILNALGNHAYRFDYEGEHYEAATSHPAYSPRREEEGMLETVNEHFGSNTTRATDVEELIFVGVGPETVFNKKDAMLIRALKGVKRVKSIDISGYFNETAGRVVSRIAKDEDREISFESLQMTYQEAAKLFPTEDGSRTMVVSTGGLFMNTETVANGKFPTKEFVGDVQALAALAGPKGRILVTYVADVGQKNIRRPYQTEEFRRLYLQLVDQIADAVPEFAELNSKNLRVVTVHDREAQILQHYLEFKKPITVEIAYQNGGIGKTNHTVPFAKGYRIPIIPSGRPIISHIEQVIADNIFDPGPVKTEYLASTERGTTLHYMSVGTNRVGGPK